MAFDIEKVTKTLKPQNHTPGTGLIGYKIKERVNLEELGKKSKRYWP